MLSKLSRAKLGLVFAIVFALIGAVVLLASQRNVPGPPRNADGDGTSVQNKADLLNPTDKTELATEPLVAPPQISPEVTAAEGKLPGSTTPAYTNACQDLKAMYGTERERNTQAENATHQANQQEIINSYSREGKSFSSSQKYAQAKELKRHKAMLEQIEKQYSRQIKSVSC